MRLAHVQVGAVNHRDRDERAVRRRCPVAVGAVVLTIVAAQHRGFTAQQQGLRHGEVVVDAARRQVRGVGDAQHGGVVLRTQHGGSVQFLVETGGFHEGHAGGSAAAPLDGQLLTRCEEDAGGGVRAGGDDQVRCGEGEALQAHVFAVADDRHPTLRVLFEAFTFARHVCEDQLGVQRIVVVLNQQVLLAGNVERLSVVFDARALGDEQGRLALGFAGGDETHLRVLGVGAGNDHGGTVGAHGGAEPHGVVRFLVNQVVFGALSDVVHVDTPGAPRLVGDEVDELFGVVDEEGARRNVGDGVFEEGAGFHVEEALLVAFVALFVHGDAQQLAVTCGLEAAEGEELHVLGVFVAVEDDDFTLEYFAGGDGRRGVAHHLVAFVQGGVAVEDGVLAAGHHAAVVPPVTDTVRDGQIRQQGAALDFVEDGFAEGLLVCGDSFGVFGFCLEVVEDLFAFLVAEPFVGVDEDVAVVFAAVLDLLRYGRGEVLFSHAATSFIELWVCEWCVPSAPAFLRRRVAGRMRGGVWARLVLVYRRVRQATILRHVRGCPAQPVEAPR